MALTNSEVKEIEVMIRKEIRILSVHVDEQKLLGTKIEKRIT